MKNYCPICKILYFFAFLVVNYEGWTTFISDMPLVLHRKLNEKLNKQFNINRALGWKYLHTKTIDHIVPINQNKTRITQDVSSGEFVSAENKQNIGHLAIFQPNCLVDVRLSINIETKISIDAVKDEINHPMKVIRKKDRMAYEVAQGLLSIDLTQVTQNNGDGNKIKHELELEVKDPEALLKSPEAFQVFIDSIRELCQAIN